MTAAALLPFARGSRCSSVGGRGRRSGYGPLRHPSVTAGWSVFPSRLLVGGAGHVRPAPPTDTAQEYHMTHYTTDELIVRWKREELTTEQMIGQLVQALATVEQRLRALERRL